MAYANASDANSWLKDDEITFSDTDATSVAALEESERIIKGKLSTVVDPTVLVSWHVSLPATPTAPAELRSISGKLAAAIYWRKAYANDASDIQKSYGQMLYREALDDLDKILSGSITLGGVDLTGGGSRLDSEEFFYPNDSTASTVNDVKFSMGSRF
jgi:hypothetical protein